MQVFLMRHADAAWGDQPDHARPLSARGVEEATRMARWLRDAGHRPTQVWCSDAQRAVETARIVHAEVGGDGPHEAPALYTAAAPDLKAFVSDLPDGCLVVGHNPTMESAVHRWVDDPPVPDDGQVMKPGSVAWLDLTRRRLLAWQRPDLLL